MPQDPDDRGGHKGLANFDVRCNLTVHFSANLPGGESLSGIGRALIAGWQASGIVSLASGMPFSVALGFDNARIRSHNFSLRPNLSSGYSSNPILGGPDQYFDPMAFELPPAGTFGNLGRNTLIGPGVMIVDLSLVKQFHVLGSRQLEFRAEMFNLLNRANFARPVYTIFDAAGRVGNAGRITNTSTAARQIQLGLRFVCSRAPIGPGIVAWVRCGSCRSVRHLHSQVGFASGPAPGAAPSTRSPQSARPVNQRLVLPATG